ncbi:MAG: HNH endonuclease family protein [Spiroplasmataceae bacterium]|nr:HNH endonuclease family protein [Spiroplasmataceae bacterium]
MGFKTILDSAKQKIRFILIEIEQPDDAFKIFESINNSGKGLTSSDLVKIDFFDVWKKNSFSEEYLKLRWDELRKRVGEKNLDNFFFSFLNTFFTKGSEFSENSFSAFFRKLLGISEKGKNLLSTIVKIRNKQIKKTNLEEFLELIIETSKIYREILNPTLKYWGRDYYLNLLEIKNLELKQLYPFVIALKLFPSKTKEDTKAEILKKIIIYFFRKYKIKKTKFAPAEVEKWISKIRDNATENILDSSELKEEIKESQLFWKKLAEINLKPKLARFILRKLYISLLPSIFIFSYEEQTEHIFPKTPDKEWWEIDEWKELKEDEDKEKLEKLTFSLGNQTLILSKENIIASNKVWKKKKQEFKEKTCLFYENDWFNKYKKNLASTENKSKKILDIDLNFFDKDKLLPCDIKQRTEILLLLLKEKNLLFVDEEIEKRQFKNE